MRSQITFPVARLLVQERTSPRRPRVRTRVSHRRRLARSRNVLGSHETEDHDPDRPRLGVDANASGMRAASRRAARRGALLNALFVMAAAERPPLTGFADEITVNFPWSSLLRGVLGGDDAVLAGIAGGRAGRDCVLAGVGRRARPATGAEIAASGSARPVTLLRATG
jgi:hypothetical protein